MKNLKKIFAVVATLATMIVLSVFFTVNTQALSLDYFGEDYTIYYYYDYYPSIDKETMEDTFGGDYTIIYDHQNVDAQTFNPSYFYGLGDNCVLIVDLKTFEPNYNNLMGVFNDLKYSDGSLKIIYVAPYTATGVPLEFINSVDVFFPSNFGKLTTFINDFVEDFAPGNVSLANSTILIDGRVIDLEAFEDAVDDDERNDVIGKSPFMRFLLQELATKIGMNFNEYSPDYCSILAALKQSHIDLFIYNGYNNYEGYYEYIDLATLNVYTTETVASFTNASTGDDFIYNKICGVGFWTLENGFYNYLLNGQGLLSDLLPVYVMESDPLVYGEGGLSIITDTDLCPMSNEEAALLAVLEDLLGYN